MNETTGKILRWSTVSSGSDHEEAMRIMIRCRDEFPDVRFKLNPTCGPANIWVDALLLHERGCGWSSRNGEGQREIRKFAEAMQESVRRWNKRQKEK